MATNYPHEDAKHLGYDKSEESFKEWERYWTVPSVLKEDGIMKAVSGIPIDWWSDAAQGNGNADRKARCLGDKGRRWIFSMRHGERVDLTYGNWVPFCFDENGTYTRKDLNLPLKLSKRAGGKESYAKDTPLTRVGRLQAQLVGEGLRLAGITIKHVYVSSALRCVETAQAFLEGLQADPSVKIKVEPGLFEYKMWHLSKGMAPFMTPVELHRAGFNVELGYRPYVELDITTPETIDEYYKRGELVVQSAVNDTKKEGGNVIFIGHAATLDVTTVALKRIDESRAGYPPYQINHNILRVPFCALSAMRDNPWQVVCPPCPPSMNSSTGRFDWRMFLDAA